MTDAPMVIIAGSYRVDVTRRDEVVAAFADTVERARAFDGCLHVAITADSVDSVDAARVNDVEVWRDSTAPDQWRAQADAPDLGLEVREPAMERYDAVDGGPLL